MAIAKITLIGMINYCEIQHDDLFYQLQLPAGVSKQTLIGNIVMKGGEFPVIWANPNFVQRMIGIWSRKMKPTFDRWVKTLAIDYEPLYNYDRFEEYQDTETNEASASGTTTRAVTGYDSNTLQTNDQTTDSSGADNERNLEHKAHLYGNIGVTTSQQMLEAEMDVSRRFNIYDLMAEEFLNEFCVRVW